jgi:hypothetical protein
MTVFKIRDITQKNAGNFCRFSIGYNNGKFFIHAEEKEWTDTFGRSISIGNIQPKRIAQLANEILTFLGQEAKIQEWKPTMTEFQWMIEKTHGKGSAIEFWFIDWLRKVVSMHDKEGIEQAVRAYEWIKGNEQWLYQALKGVQDGQ